MRVSVVRRSLTTLAACCALVAMPALADSLGPWRGRTIKDATGSSLVQRTMPNWDVVFDRAPQSPLAGAPTIDVRRNYIYIQDTDGSLRIPYQAESDLNASFEFVFRQIYATLPDEFVFIYMFTAFETGVGAFFYAPLVNTDSGIGQRRFNQQTGSRVLQGFVFMNDWQSFNQQFRGAPTDVIQGFARSVFNQEAGHRWGTQFESGPGVGDGYLNQLLGRDDAHWSYFVNTGGSPMEGNRWRDNGNGSFTTTTDVRAFNYSDVDLYLMGLLPPAQVQPWFMITNPNLAGKRDIYNQALNAASPPQIFDPMTVNGTRLDFTVQDLVSRLGTRSPAAGTAPNRWRVVFAMLGGRNNGLNEAQRVQFEGMVDMYAEGFRLGTRGLGTLDYELRPATPKTPLGGACTMPDECAEDAPICTAPAQGNGNICTRSCANATGCPADHCCEIGPEFGGRVCMPAAMCPAVAPDAGVVDTGTPVETDAGTTPTDPDGGAAACACDTTNLCDQGCACDIKCQPCACDTTTGCEANCACDPDVACVSPPVINPIERDSGCGCTTTDAGSQALALLLVAGLWLARRRRA